MALLEHLEPRMQQAQNEYLSSLYHDDKLLVQEIYNANSGTHPINFGCGRCWLAVMKDLGNQYFKQKAEMEAEAAAATKKKNTKKAAK